MMGLLVSGGLAASRLGQPAQSLGEAAAVLRRQLCELDSHARGRFAAPAPGNPRHSATGSQRLAGRQGDLQTQAFAHFEEQVGAQEDPAFGQIGRAQPDASLDPVAGSANDHGQERIPTGKPPRVAAPW
jgi:hypothetical protein